MSLPPGFDWLTGDINVIVQDFLNVLNRPFQFHQFRQFWSLPFTTTKSASFRTLHFSPLPSAPIYDLDRAMAAFQNDLTPTIKSLCQEWNGVKVWTVLYARYESANPMDEHYKVMDVYLPVAHTIFLRQANDVDADGNNPYHHGLNILAQRLLALNAKFIRGKSSLVLAEIYSLNMNVVRFVPLSGAAWSPLPQFIQNKQAIVNVQNEDERCFGYAIASALHPINHGNHSNRPNNYIQYFEEEHLIDIDYPVNPNDMPQLEETLNLSINLYSYFDDIGKAIHPMYISRHNSPRQIDLLYFKEHYAWIKDFSRLFAHLNKHNGHYFYCKRCLGHFQLESAFERHQQLCTREDYISTLHILPEPGSTIKFINWKYMTEAPFVIYADL